MHYSAKLLRPNFPFFQIFYFWIDFEMFNTFMLLGIRTPCFSNRFMIISAFYVTRDPKLKPKLQNVTLEEWHCVIWQVFMKTQVWLLCTSQCKQVKLGLKLCPSHAHCSAHWHLAEAKLSVWKLVSCIEFLLPNLNITDILNNNNLIFKYSWPGFLINWFLL